MEMMASVSSAILRLRILSSLLVRVFTLPSIRRCKPQHTKAIIRRCLSLLVSTTPPAGRLKL